MHVKWLKERHAHPLKVKPSYSPFTRFAIDWPGQNAPLAVLRARLADLTHLPSAGFKIIHAGAVMKDDNAPLSAYRLNPHSTVVVVGHDNSLSPLPTSYGSDERLTIAQIQSEHASVRTLAPDVHAFLAALNPPAHAPPSTRDHARLGELLLQCLLRLDAIDPGRDWPTARAERKAAVKEAQQLLDSLDAAWATYSSNSSPSPPS